MKNRGRCRRTGTFLRGRSAEAQQVPNTVLMHLLLKRAHADDAGRNWVCKHRNRAADDLFGGRNTSSREFLRNKTRLGVFYLLYTVCTTSQGIQLHLHLKVKIQTSRKIEVLFLLWKQWRLQWEKHSRDMRRFKLVLQVVLTSQQQPRFFPSSRHFGSTAKSQSLRNCKFTPVGFHFSSSGKGGRGAKTDGSCQPAQKWDASGGVLFMEMFRSNNHRSSLILVGEGEFGSYGPILPSFKHLL